MWEETTASILREAHRTRDSVIERWMSILRTAALREGAPYAGGSRMKSFKKYPAEEIRRLNELQAAYFSKNVHLFDPPLPEGVPERLGEIVQCAEITPSDTVLDIGTGTGILVSRIREYSPVRIYAIDLSQAMLDSVKEQYTSVITMLGDIGHLALPDESIDVAFINACYSNIIDKHKAFANIQRMFRPGGRLIISHPLGSSFVAVLKQNVPFPLDDFPSDASEASELFAPYGLQVSLFVNKEKLYILRLDAPPGKASEVG